MKKKAIRILGRLSLAGVLTVPLWTAGAYGIQAEDDSLYSLEPVVITASKTPKKLAQADADISVVTRAEIETMHIQNVEEALRMVPGVQFLNYGATNLDANLNGIRINGSNDIVILVDGVRMTDFQGARSSGYMYAPMLKNMDNIERIEVLRGAAATMYGSGAKGGVINIITRNPSKTQTTIDMSEGAFHRENYQINTQGKADKLTYNAYYSKNIQGNVKDPTGYVWPGHSNSKAQGVKLAYDFNAKSQLMFNYNNIKNDFSNYDMYYKQDVRDAKYYANDMTLQHRYVFSDKWQNTMTYRRNRVYSIGYLSYSGRLTPFWNNRFRYRFFSDQLTYQSSRHTVVMGVDYSKAINLKKKTSKYDTSPTWMSNVSPYIQESWKILPKVTLEGGLRYDKPKRSDHANFDSHTSKSYKLSYAATSKDTLYMGRSDFYILPGLFELTDSKYGNSKLLPAYGRTSSIGYTRTFSDRNLFTLNWFYTKANRTIGYDDEGKYQNYTNDVARGWNAQWNSTINSHWQMNLGWSHLYQKADGDNFSKGYQPKDLATMGIYYHQGRWDAGLDGFYFIRRTVKLTGWQANKKGWPSDKYGVFNLSVGYQMSDHVNLYVKVSNLFNKLWCEQTQALWGKPGQYYAQPERTFLIGTQIKF